MIKVIAFKNEHTIYNNIREAVNKLDIKEDLYIIGLDLHGSIDHIDYKDIFIEVYNSNNKFILYLEEPSAFASTEIGPDGHWQITGGVPYQIINNFISNNKFLGFFTHIKSACSAISTEYGLPCYYLPISMEYKDRNRIKKRIDSLQDYNRPVNFLNWGTFRSQAQIEEAKQNIPHSFVLQDEQHQYKNRGGDIVDILIGSLLQNGINCTYSYRSFNKRPIHLQFPDKINMYSDYLDINELDELFYNTDMFLLPADQIRACSISRAMSFGIPCLVTNGWGFDELCLDGFNSIVIDKKNCDTCRNRGLPVCQHILDSTVDRFIKLVNSRTILQNLSYNTLSDSVINYDKDSYIEQIKKIFNYLDIR